MASTKLGELFSSDILLSPVHSGKLYGAGDIAYAINDVADVTTNPSMFTKVDILYCRTMGYFGRTSDQHMLHVCRETRQGRHDGSSKYSLLFRCFGSMEAGRGAHVVLSCVTMEDTVRDGLVCYLS